MGLSQIAYSTFGPGGAGSVLFQLMLIAVVSWLLTYVVGAAGNGQVASMIKVVATFICIGIVAAAAWKAIQAIAGIAGLQ